MEARRDAPGSGAFLNATTRGQNQPGGREAGVWPRFQTRVPSWAVSPPQSLLQSLDGGVSQGTPNPQSFLYSHGFCSPQCPAMSHSPWDHDLTEWLPRRPHPSLEVLAPGLPRWSQDVAEIVGLWRSLGCHGPLGSTWAHRKGWAVIIMP